PRVAPLRTAGRGRNDGVHQRRMTWPRPPATMKTRDQRRLDLRTFLSLNFSWRRNGPTRWRRKRKKMRKAQRRPVEGESAARSVKPSRARTPDGADCGGVRRRQWFEHRPRLAHHQGLKGLSRTRGLDWTGCGGVYDAGSGSSIFC
ncbi:unnamed protein product, partial [Laminaria digitata]